MVSANASKSTVPPRRRPADRVIARRRSDSVARSISSEAWDGGFSIQTRVVHLTPRPEPAIDAQLQTPRISGAPLSSASGRVWEPPQGSYLVVDRARGT